MVVVVVCVCVRTCVEKVCEVLGIFQADLGPSTLTWENLKRHHRKRVCTRKLKVVLMGLNIQTNKGGFNLHSKNFLKFGNSV